jgi:cell division protein DivIC
MKNPLKKLTDKHPLLRFLSNKYVLVSVFFIIWMLFLDNYSYLDHRLLNKEIDELESNKEYYQQEIEKDKKNIKILKNPHQVEKFAREKYYMKKDSEDIYIIEYERDSVK